MLRSFAAVANAALTSNETSESSRNEITQLQFWLTSVTDTFLASYRETAAYLYNDDWEVARQLLDIFILEQAFNELREGLAHQPDPHHPNQVSDALRAILMLRADTRPVGGTATLPAQSKNKEHGDGDAE